jgi:signal transduction histidine kinase
MSVKLDKSFSELARKNKELDQFGYVVSHDLKAPLRGIDNIVRWIEEDHQHELSTPLKKYIELVKGRILRLEALINGLLEYSKIGRTKLIIDTVNVTNMIKEIAEIIVPKSFTFSIKGCLEEFPAEKLRLEQVFTNLISNAVKYHDKPGGTITVSCEEFDKDFYQFEVRDDGPGIAAEYHEKIFIIFQTLKEKDAFESTGVGLAIVKKIIDEQKGTIKVVSEPGQGSAFIFTWPKKPFKSTT